MSVPFSVGTVWYAEDAPGQRAFGTWQITAITATEVKCIASSYTPSFLGREFSMDKHDFQARLDPGVYKKAYNI